MSTRCHACGLYNFATAPVCRRCNVSLPTVPPPAQPRVVYSPAPATGLRQIGRELTPGPPTPSLAPPPPAPSLPPASYHNPGYQNGNYANPVAPAPLAPFGYPPPPMNAGHGYRQPAPYPIAGLPATGPYFPPPGGPYSTSSGGTKKKVFAVLGVVAVCFFVGLRVLFAYLPSSPFFDRSKAALRGDPTGEKTLPISYLKSPGSDHSSEAGIRDNLKAYLDGDPMYGGEEIVKHFFDDAGSNEQYITAVHYDRKSGDVLLQLKYPFEVPPYEPGGSTGLYVDYFASDREMSRQQRHFLRTRLDDSSLLLYGEEFRTRYGDVVPGGWRGRLRPPPQLPAGYLVATPLRNLRLSATQTVNVPITGDVGFKGGPPFAYNISVSELSMFLANANTYGGAMRILDEDLARRQLNIVANHGAFVARPDEPSLSRLVRRLTGGLALPREVKIQLVSSLASNGIIYDSQESRARGEILKRANETLLSRRGDCSSKTILLASLLEQFHEDYLLVYYKDHINVAVPTGNFRVTNGLSFEWEGKSWVVAETTVQGFVIGDTQIESDGGAAKGLGKGNLIADIELIQRPSEVGVVYDYHSKKKVKLL